MIEIIGYEHAGVRVHDRTSAVSFYRELGFAVDPACTDATAVELVNAHGVRLNLICNSIRSKRNVLQDSPTKYPGITHMAFAVRDLAEALRSAKLNGWTVTEGPKDAERRRYFFIRDPDGNVIELNELKT